MKLYYAYDIEQSLKEGFQDARGEFKYVDIVGAGYMPLDPLVIHSDLVQELLK